MPQFPAFMIPLIQTGLLFRGFYEGLFPNLLYRSEAAPEEWAANSGTEIIETRPGLIAVDTEPLQPGQDPEDSTYAFEQWSAIQRPYGKSISTEMLGSVNAISSKFLQDVNQLGLNAAQTMNRLPRNKLFQAYLAGHSVLIEATGTNDTSIHVSAVNGFTDVIVDGTARPQTVSPTAPLSITIIDGATEITRNVIGYQLDNPKDPLGPGRLMLSQTVGAVVANRSSVLSSVRSQIIRSGGGTNVDAISSSDLFVLQDAITAVGRLRDRSVPPHDDGFYHAHINNTANTQVFADPAWQRLHTGTGTESVAYRYGFIGTIGNIAYFLNPESPNDINSGAKTATGNKSFYSKGIGGETVNANGVKIGRILVTGKGAIREKWLDHMAMVTEAGTTGKLGKFNVTQNGAMVNCDRVQLIIRAPLDKLQRIVTASWAWTGDHPTPSDITADSGPERYKRAIIIEHAL